MNPPDPNRSSEPESIGDVLGRLFAARGWGRQQERLRYEKAWAEVAGQFLEETRVLSFRRKVLEIEVRSPVLMQELAQFHKRRLLGLLKPLLKGVPLSDIKFRTGVW
jgi:predicted nucleic acid-binding Zn ribbon protein